MKPADVLNFWLGEQPITTLEQLKERAQFWMLGDALDEPVREKFGEALKRAVVGEYDHWADTLEGQAALIILLDQFPRHIHRGTPEQYVGDEKALALARALHDRGDDKKLSIFQRIWAHMPFAHHEDLASIERLVGIADKIKADGPDEFAPLLDIGCSQSRKALNVMQRFGRFPHRNEILGRVSTPEEIEFLKTYQHGPNVDASLKK